MNRFVHVGLLAGLFMLLGFSGQVAADRGGNVECPVGLVNGLELDDEFGPGTEALTGCIKKRHQVKVVVQVNQFCRDAVPNPACTRPYALGNIRNMIADYEITHGMMPGLDYEIVAVVHSGGAWLMLQDGFTFDDNTAGTVTISNQFQGLVESLMDQGVRFLFCQNTTRGFIRANRLPSFADGEGSATAALIPGVGYTTAGLTSIADLQSQGYRYIQP
jgi:intracellular sulfur oxidation DsrE/DsrF family protein